MKKSRVNKLGNFSLLAILFTAVFFRISALETFPFGFSVKEVNIGYDAYSILLTGKDQWGKTLPLVFQTFTEQRLPLYTYLTMPFIALFGLNEYSVRLPNALVGTAAVYFTYLLTGELGRRSKFKVKEVKKLQTISSLLLAISPWHIVMSRGAFEANLTTFLLPMGIYLYLRSYNKPKYLYYTAVIFFLNFLVHPSVTFLTIIMMLVLAYLYPKIDFYLNSKVKLTLAGVIIVFISLSFFANKEVFGFYFRENFFSDNSKVSATEKLIAYESGMSSVFVYLFHNTLLLSGKDLIENYVKYSSYEFLFMGGNFEDGYGMVNDHGVSYWFALPFMVFFLAYFFSNSKDRSVWLITIWLVLAPIPAAFVSKKSYLLSYPISMLPALQILCGYGAMKMIEVFKKQKWIKYLYVPIILFSFIFFLERYFVISPIQNAAKMDYGNIHAAKLALTEYPDNSEIVVSESINNFQIYLAFIDKTDPSEYHKYSEDWLKDGVIPLEYRLNNFVFKKIDWNTDSVTYQYFIGRPDDFPATIEPTGTIYYPTLEPAIVFVNSNINTYAYLNK